MSCPDEAALLRYSDGELRDAALRDIEGHLMGCRDCRTRVVELQSESLLLADVLQERARHAQVFAHGARVAPEPGMAFGLPAAIAVVAAALAVGGALLEARLPGGLDLLHPLRSKGAFAMLFDLVFMLRDRAPGLLELGVAFGGIASVAALLSFAVGAFYRRVFGAILLALGLLAGADSARALELRHVHGGDVRIGADETVDQTLVVSSRNLRVEGVVEGDLIAAVDRIQISGTLRGNLYAFARRIEITGTVTGSIVALAENADLDGRVEGSAYLACERMDLRPHGRIERDLAFVSDEGVLSGRVDRDVFFGGERLELGGEVGRNVTARWHARRVTLLDAARIGGDLDLWLGSPEDLDRASGAQVAGQVRPHESPSARDRYLAAYRDPAVWALHGVALVASFFFGVLIHAFAPRLLEVRLSTAKELFSALGRGFVALLVTPIALLLLILTLIGIPIAILGLFAFAVALYMAEIVVAAWIGVWLMPPRSESTWSFGRPLLAGLVAVWVAEHIPFVGLAVFVVVLLTGLGCLAARARAALQSAGRAALPA